MKMFPIEILTGYIFLTQAKALFVEINVVLINHVRDIHLIHILSIFQSNVNIGMFLSKEMKQRLL